MEQAAYELLLQVAERAGDEETASVARQILEQERAMADRLARTTTAPWRPRCARRTPTTSATSSRGT